MYIVICDLEKWKIFGSALRKTYDAPAFVCRCTKACTSHIPKQLCEAGIQRQPFWDLCQHWHTIFVYQGKHNVANASCCSALVLLDSHFTQLVLLVSVRPHAVMLANIRKAPSVLAPSVPPRDLVTM